MPKCDVLFARFPHRRSEDPDARRVLRGQPSFLTHRIAARKDDCPLSLALDFAAHGGSNRCGSCLSTNRKSLYVRSTVASFAPLITCVTWCGTAMPSVVL